MQKVGFSPLFSEHRLVVEPVFLCPIHTHFKNEFSVYSAIQRLSQSRLTGNSQQTLIQMCKISKGCRFSKIGSQSVPTPGGKTFWTVYIATIQFRTEEIDHQKMVSLRVEDCQINRTAHSR